MKAVWKSKCFQFQYLRHRKKTVLTQLGKAGTNSPLAATEVHQEGQLQLALHIPSVSPVLPVI